MHLMKGPMLNKQTKDEKSGRLAATFEGKNVLVTGGFGFVGGHMTRVLVGLGAHVTVLDVRTGTDIDSMINAPEHQLRDKV